MTKTQNKIGHFMIAAGCVMEDIDTGKILCLQRDRSNFLKGEWELMYGRIDQHEEIDTGLRREVFEETGITDFKIKKLLRIWHIYRGQKKADTEVFGFTFHCLVKSPRVILSPEHSDYKWVKPSEALKLIKSEGIKQDVELLIKKRLSIVYSDTSNKLRKII